MVLLELSAQCESVLATYCATHTALFRRQSTPSSYHLSSIASANNRLNNNVRLKMTCLTDKTALWKSGTTHKAYSRWP